MDVDPLSGRQSRSRRSARDLSPSTNPILFMTPFSYFHFNKLLFLPLIVANVPTSSQNKFTCLGIRLSQAVFANSAAVTAKLTPTSHPHKLRDGRNHRRRKGAEQGVCGTWSGKEEGDEGRRTSDPCARMCARAVPPAFERRLRLGLRSIDD